MNYITFTNKGSLDFCENLLLSSKNVGIEKDFVVYCLDEESYDVIKNNYECESKLFDSSISGIFHEYGKDDFRKITETKIKVILNALEEYDSLVYTDSDVVFLENPTDIILKAVDVCKTNNYNVDIFFASDEPFMNICTGFMYINNTEVVRSLFEKYFELSNIYKEQGSECMYDQEIIFSILRNNMLGKRLTWATYPTTLIKNGHLYWNEPEGRTGKEAVVHVNFTIGKLSKINRLKEANLWYVKEGVEV